MREAFQMLTVLKDTKSHCTWPSGMDEAKKTVGEGYVLPEGT
jgi:hypothetical protein